MLLAAASALVLASCGGDDASDESTPISSTTAPVDVPPATDAPAEAPTEPPADVPATDPPAAADGGTELGAALFPGEADACPLLDDTVVLATMSAGDEVEIVLKNDGGQTVDAEFATRCDYLGVTFDTVRVSTLPADTGGDLDVDLVVELLRSAEIEPVTVDGAADAVYFSTADVETSLPESDESSAWNVASNQTGFDVPSAGLAASDGERLVIVYHDVSFVDARDQAVSIAAGVFAG